MSNDATRASAQGVPKVSRRKFLANTSVAIAVTGAVAVPAIAASAEPKAAVAPAACTIQTDAFNPDAGLLRLIAEWREADAQDTACQEAYCTRYDAYIDELERQGMTMEQDRKNGHALCHSFGAYRLSPEEGAWQKKELELAKAIVLTSPRTLPGIIAKADALRRTLRLDHVGDGPDCLTQQQLLDMDWGLEGQLRFINEVADLLGRSAVQSC